MIFTTALLVLQLIGTKLNLNGISFTGDLYRIQYEAKN